MSIFEKRMSSFVDRGNKLIAEGKTNEAMKLITQGLQHYSDLILHALTPYSESDAGLLVFALRHIADEIEKNNPAAKATLRRHEESRHRTAADRDSEGQKGKPPMIDP